MNYELKIRFHEFSYQHLPLQVRLGLSKSRERLEIITGHDACTSRFKLKEFVIDIKNSILGLKTQIILENQVLYAIDLYLSNVTLIKALKTHQASWG